MGGKVGQDSGCKVIRQSVERNNRIVIGMLILPEVNTHQFAAHPEDDWDRGRAVAACQLSFVEVEPDDNLSDSTHSSHFQHATPPPTRMHRCEMARDDLRVIWTEKSHM